MNMYVRIAEQDLTQEKNVTARMNRRGKQSVFKCEECGHLFEEGEEKVIVEPFGEKYTVCPRCEGLYEEVKPCKICGSYEEMQCGETFCDNCRIEVQKTFEQLLNKHFTVEQRELLNVIYEGEEL